MRIKRVAVAMSGGVDSGVAAALVVKAGYKAVGFHMRLWQESHLRGGPGLSSEHLGGVSFENKCCSTESLEAARKTAHKLGIPFYIVDLEKIFKKRVVDYFLKEYGLGRTPNPCIRCNRFIKFGELLRNVRKLGYDYLATGHYARVRSGMAAPSGSLAPLASGSSRRASGLVKSERRTSAKRDPLVKRPTSETTHYSLLMAKNRAKDQSYFLYNLNQKQLAQVMFPVGVYFKKEVKAMAKKWKLPAAERPESQEICFFPESDYRSFLKRQIGEKIIPGEVVDTQRRVIGKHHGIPLYTIGQRHGFEIGVGKREVKPGLIPPFYVVGKDVKKNQLIVGFGKETERKEFWVKEVNWIDGSSKFTRPRPSRPVLDRVETRSGDEVGKIQNSKGLKCKVRIRHQGELLDCRVIRNTQYAKRKVKKSVSRITYHVSLVEPERAIAPGQAAVFYKRVKEQESRRVKKEEYEVLGGGIIAINPAKSRGAQALCGIAGSRT